MGTSWTHVRISQETLEAIHGLQVMWEEGLLAQDWAPSPTKMHVSVDRVIQELIRRDREHRSRAADQRRRRQKPYERAAVEADKQQKPV